MSLDIDTELQARVKRARAQAFNFDPAIALTLCVGVALLRFDSKRHPSTLRCVCRRCRRKHTACDHIVLLQRCSCMPQSQ
mmetsp:Transcript_11644/g.25149  ORF Transcript_11644/g.25149 Transcript_11644/m.25149 type:complete len:80 (+) Transcript_11644:1126-1365(+)